MTPDTSPPPNDTTWGRAVRRLGVVMYPGEGRAASLLFASFFLCVTFQYAGKTVRQATFVDALGATKLPWVYLLVALLSYPVARLYTHLSRRVAHKGLVLGTFGMSAVGLVAFWWLFGYPWSWVPIAFYVWISIAIALTMSQLWLLASDVFDARQAKRLFGFLGGGALLGGIAGGLVARTAASVTTTRDSLLVAAVLVVGVMLVIPLVRTSAAASKQPPVPTAPAESHLALLRRSGHLRLVAALMLTTIVVSQVVDLQFNWAVESTTSGLEDRTEFFGSFFSLMGVAALLFQILFTSRIHRLLGVGFALRVLPASLTAGTLALFITGTLLPGGLIVAALALKVAESGIRYSLDDSTRELLFLPVPASDRMRAKTFIDVLVKRGAKGVAAVLLLPVTLGWFTPLQAGWLSLAVIAVWWVVTSKLLKEYIRSFRRGLKQIAVAGDAPINLADVTTLEILVQSLGSPDARQVLHSLDLLADNDRGRLVPPLLLYHEDAQVRQRTLQILAVEGREDAAPLVEGRLSDDSPEVRAEATRVLAELRHQDACDMMHPRLRSPDPGVRAAAIACLTNHGDEAARAEAARALEDMVSDDDPAIRTEAAQAIGAIEEPHFAGRLVQLLYDPEPAVVRTAVQGIRQRCHRDCSNPLYLPTLISLLVDRRLKHDAREALAAFGQDAIPALRLFMNEPEEPIWVRRAIPKTIAKIPHASAREVLTDCLESQTDAFLRRKLLEALGSMAGKPAGPAAEAKIRREIHVEAKRYLVTLADLHALNLQAATAVDRVHGPLPQGLGLLEKLLAERATDHFSNLFALLALLYDQGPIQDACRGLRDPRLRAGALEFLDYSLAGDEQRDVLAAIGDAPLVDKLSRAERHFGIARASKPATLLKHLSPHDDHEVDAPFLAVGAIYTVHDEGIRDLFPVIESLAATAADPFVVETAVWAHGRARERDTGPT